MRFVRLALLALFALTSLAHAQTGSVKTPTQLNAEINAQCPNNTIGLCTPFIYRQHLLDIVASTTAICVNIYAYNGVGDNATDNTPAYNAAIVALSGAKKCIYFPAGKYKFMSTPNAWSTSSDSDSITIKGDGADVTELTFPSVGAGFTINLQSPRNSVHLRDFSLTTGTAGAVNGFGIQLVQNGSNQFPADDAPSDISGVTIRGTDGYFNAGTNYWTTGAVVTNLSNVNWINDYFIGQEGPGTGFTTVGIGALVRGTYNGSTCTKFPVAHNFVVSYFNQLGTGVQLGECVQGMAFNGVNITGGSTGILVPAGLHNLTEMAVTGSQINTAVYGILVQSNMWNTIISSTVFYVTDPFMTGNIGVSLQGGTCAYTITGNAFALIGNGTLNGLVLNEDCSSGKFGIVSANNFYNGTATNGTGIWLQSGAKDNFVTGGNAFTSLTNNVVNAGTDNFVYGNIPEFQYTIAQVLALTCNAVTKGRIVQLADTVASGAPTYNGTVTGGGATTVNVPAMCNGTNWTYH